MPQSLEAQGTPTAAQALEALERMLELASTDWGPASTDEPYEVLRAFIESSGADAERWKPIETAPKNGTWILGLNNAGNCAVIIWSTNALRRQRYPVPACMESSLESQFKVGEGWIFPFSTGEVSPFWEGARVTHWMPLPAPPDAARAQPPKETP